VEPTGPAARGKSLAVVVTVQDYTALPKLKYCRADGELIAETLKKFCGFGQVILLAEDAKDSRERPTLGNLSNQLRNWLTVANSGEYQRVLVYFGGHGFRDDKGRLYFAPPDCDPKNLELTALPQSYVKQMLDGCNRVRVKLLVLDCCHAGEGRGEGVGVSGSALAEVFKNAKGLLTLASCADKEISLEWGEKCHGLYTYWLCQGLQGQADEQGNRDGVVDHQELHTYALKNVMETAARLGRQQTPVLLPSDDWKGIASLADARCPTPPESAIGESSAGKAKPAPAGISPPTSPSQGEKPGISTPDSRLEVINNSIGMKLVLIPAGKFLMGSPASDKNRWETPRHSVQITKPFFLGAHEVTVGQFRRFVKETGYMTEHEKNTPTPIGGMLFLTYRTSIPWQR
jgi:hypothetical protein